MQHARPHSVAEGTLRDVDTSFGASAGTGGARDFLVTVGPVDRSHPGWRPHWSNRKEKDLNLRNDDIDGMYVCVCVCACTCTRV